jgi:hypothetical protein
MPDSTPTLGMRKSAGEPKPGNADGGCGMSLRSVLTKNWPVFST